MLYIIFKKMEYSNKINRSKGIFSDFVAISDMKITPNYPRISVTWPYIKRKIYFCL